MLSRGLFVLLFIASYIFSFAQPGVIKLNNPSFEGTPQHSKVPRGWYNCSPFPAESPPDIQPDTLFQVDKPPAHGGSYLGMVVRDNETWESVGQRLKVPLKGGTCYDFKMTLARSQYYVSFSRTSGAKVNYTTGAKIRIWGGNKDYYDKAELLAETGRINNSRWMENSFKLEPSTDYVYIIIEAYYVTPTLFAYNGNILLDNASDLIPMPCDEEILASEEEPKVNKKPEPKPKPTPKEPEPKVEPEPVVAAPVIKEEPKVVEAPKPKVLKELNTKTLKEGQTIRINQLYFEADTFGLTEQSIPVLNEIYEFMNANKAIALEVGGHTNGMPEHDFCDRLSKQRAKTVVDYLVEKGISKDRLEFKGYGKRKPIASNRTREGRKKNQRVEIKVLSM